MLYPHQSAKLATAVGPCPGSGNVNAVADGAHPAPVVGVDVLFVDHEKTLYLDDLRLVEAAGLLNAGAVVAADNVLSFGQPLTVRAVAVNCCPCPSDGNYSLLLSLLPLPRRIVVGGRRIWITCEGHL